MNLPIEFEKKMKAFLGNEWEEFLYSYDNNRFQALRFNTLKVGKNKSVEEEIAGIMDKLGIPMDKKVTWANDAYYYDEKKRPGKHPYHEMGLYYIQEPSAMSAAALLAPKPGMRVLDLCAAPGGKSTQLATYLGDSGLLVSNEINTQRSRILSQNIERMGIKNAVVTNEDSFALAAHFPNFFHAIQVDAPCSGEGMFRKDSTAESEWSDEHVKSCAERQLKILNSAKNALKDGGVMVYSTCTFSVEENEGVIGRVLEENPDFKLEDANVNFGRPTLEYARRIFPMDGGEGHFAARLKKSGELYKNSFTENSKKKIDSKIFDFYDSLFIGRPFGENIEVIGDKIIVLPQEYVPYEKLPVLRSGIILGQIVKNRIEPHHSAFMAAKADEGVSKVDFDVNSAEIKAFLHGEEVAVDNNIKGYTAVCVNGITVGFGKCSNGRLKNKYPKGLRLL